MAMWVVMEGDAECLVEMDDDDKEWWREPTVRESYGRDWIAVDAASAAEALEQARQYDARQHPAQTEMELFAAAYRAGAFRIEELDD